MDEIWLISEGTSRLKAFLYSFHQSKNNTLLLLSSSKGQLYSHELQSNKKELSVTEIEIWRRLKLKSPYIFQWSNFPCAFK